MGDIEHAPIVVQWLRSHVNVMSHMLEKMPEWRGRYTTEFEQYLLDFGTSYPWREPDWNRYEPGEQGQCYRESSTLAIDNDDLRYVEGVAVNYGDMPIAHGWCVDADGFVVDVTWPVWFDTDRLARRQYYGVEIDTERLRELIVTHEYWGVLPFMIQEDLALDYVPVRGGF